MPSSSFWPLVPHVNWVHSISHQFPFWESNTNTHTHTRTCFSLDSSLECYFITKFIFNVNSQFLRQETSCVDLECWQFYENWLQIEKLWKCFRSWEAWGWKIPPRKHLWGYLVSQPACVCMWVWIALSVLENCCCFFWVFLPGLPLHNHGFSVCYDGLLPCVAF